jgi:hypothetical protein
MVVLMNVVAVASSPSSASLVEASLPSAAEPLINRSCCMMLHILSPAECNTIVFVVVSVEVIIGAVLTGVISSIQPDWTLSFGLGSALFVVVTFFAVYILKRIHGRILMEEAAGGGVTVRRFSRVVTLGYENSAAYEERERV